MPSCLIFFGKLMVLAYVMENNPEGTEKWMTADYKEISWREKNWFALEKWVGVEEKGAAKQFL